MAYTQVFNQTSVQIQNPLYTSAPKNINPAVMQCIHLIELLWCGIYEDNPRLVHWLMMPMHTAGEEPIKV